MGNYLLNWNREHNRTVRPSYTSESVRQLLYGWRQKRTFHNQQVISVSKAGWLPLVTIQIRLIGLVSHVLTPFFSFPSYFCEFILHVCITIFCVIFSNLLSEILQNSAKFTFSSVHMDADVITSPPPSSSAYGIDKILTRITKAVLQNGRSPMTEIRIRNKQEHEAENFWQLYKHIQRNKIEGKIICEYY